MKYFRVKFGSEMYCGFDTQFVVVAEDEDSVFDTELYYEKLENQKDYQLGWAEEGDDLDDVAMVMVSIEEIDEETYIEEEAWN
ncbi:MAG: hypothetical protein ACOCZ5_03060 [bacterium]